MNKKETADEGRDHTWKTADGALIKLINMDASHVHNCIGMIRRRVRREIESVFKNGNALRVEIAAADAVAVTLKSIKGSLGGDLAMQIKKNIETEYNNTQKEVTEQQVDDALLNDKPYQHLTHEIKCRERDTQDKIQEALDSTPQENFFESKGKAQITKFSMRPDSLPIVACCNCDKEISRKIKQGDYVGINDDLFRITYISRTAQSGTGNDLLELTLNARRSSEKELILKALKPGESYDIY